MRLAGEIGLKQHVLFVFFCLLMMMIHDYDYEMTDEPHLDLKINVLDLTGKPG